MQGNDNGQCRKASYHGKRQANDEAVKQYAELEHSDAKNLPGRLFWCFCRLRRFLSRMTIRSRRLWFRTAVQNTYL